MSVQHITNKQTKGLAEWLTPWSRVLPEKPTGSQLLKKFPAFYGTRRFIAASTTARHLSLSRATVIQSVPPHPISWRSTLILSSLLCLHLPSGLFPPGLPTYTLYSPLLSPIRATRPAHHILLDLITRITSNLSLSNLYSLVTLSLFGPNILRSTQWHNKTS